MSKTYSQVLKWDLESKQKKRLGLRFHPWDFMLSACDCPPWQREKEETTGHSLSLDKLSGVSNTFVYFKSVVIVPQLLPLLWLAFHRKLCEIGETPATGWGQSRAKAVSGETLPGRKPDSKPLKTKLIAAHPFFAWSRTCAETFKTC